MIVAWDYCSDISDCCLMIIAKIIVIVAWDYCSDISDCCLVIIALIHVLAIVAW